MNMADIALSERRGPYDGQKFFSRSPFRSGYFIVGTSTCLICIILILFAVWRTGARIGSLEFLFFVQLAWGILIPWWRAMQHVNRVRQLFAEGSVDKVDPGSPLDVAMGAAAGAINDLITFLPGTICFLLWYIIVRLKQGA